MKRWSAICVVLVLVMMLSLQCFADDTSEYVRDFQVSDDFKTVTVGDKIYNNFETIMYYPSSNQLSVRFVWSEFLTKSVVGQKRYTLADWITWGQFEMLNAREEYFTGAIARYGEPVFIDRVLWINHAKADKYIEDALKLGRSGKITGGRVLSSKLSDADILSILKDKSSIMNYQRLLTDDGAYIKAKAFGEVYATRVSVPIKTFAKNYGDIEYFLSKYTVTEDDPGYIVFEDLDEFYSYLESPRPIESVLKLKFDKTTAPSKVSFTLGSPTVKSRIKGVTKVVKVGTIPIMDRGRALLPLRDSFENLGSKVLWDAKTKIITVDTGKEKIFIDTVKRTLIKGLDMYDISGAYIIQDGRTYLRISIFRDILGYRVRYTEDIDEVSIIEQVK